MYTQHQFRYCSTDDPCRPSDRFGSLRALGSLAALQTPFGSQLGEQPSDLARPGWLDLASIGSIWLLWMPGLARFGFPGRSWALWLARSGCPERLWASILLRRGSVFIDFAAQGQCFVKVALGASIWCSCALWGALAASIWRSWGPLGTSLGCSWAFLGRSGVLLDALGALLGRFGVALGPLGLLLGALEGSGVALGRSWGALGWLDWVQTNAPTTALTMRLAKKIDVQQDVLPRRCLPRSLCIDASCLKSSLINN